jgi:hypothetical protein
MEIANSWAVGENHVRKPRPRNDDEEDDRKHPNDSSSGTIFARRGEIAGTKRLLILISLQQVMLIDVMIDMMIGAVNDVLITVIIIVVGLEAVEATRGITLRGYLNCLLRGN